MRSGLVAPVLTAEDAPEVVVGDGLAWGVSGLGVVFERSLKRR